MYLARKAVNVFLRAQRTPESFGLGNNKTNLL